MKIIHTADWHLGKVLNEYSLLEDQSFFLAQLFEMIKQENADVLIIAGDIYDRSVPPSQAVCLLNQIFERIVCETGAKVIAISGNHDGGERLSFGSKMLRASGIYLETVYQNRPEKITLPDEYGMVNFYLLPYFDTAQVRLGLGDDRIKNANDAFGALMEQNRERVDLNQRNVLVAHGFFADLGGRQTDDAQAQEIREQSSCTCEQCVGTSELMDISCTRYFDYVALGHLHRPQKAGAEHIRYAGSLLKYSKSEAGQNKSVTVIELKEKGEVTIRPVTIPPLRDVVVLRGSLDELTDKTRYPEAMNFDNYVYAELTDEGAVYDAINALRSIFPNTLGISFVRPLFNQDRTVTIGNRDRRDDPLVLFAEFLKEVEGKEMTLQQREVMLEAISQASGEGKTI